MSTHDDPRLTAYALGELEGPERAEVEALLAADPEAREAVDAVRAAAGDLEEALAAGPLPVLDAAHRGAVEAALAASAAPPAPVLPLRGLPTWSGVAAASVLVGAGLVLAMPERVGVTVVGSAPETLLALRDREVGEQVPLNEVRAVSYFTPAGKRVSGGGAGFLPSAGSGPDGKPDLDIGGGGGGGGHPRTEDGPHATAGIEFSRSGAAGGGGAGGALLIKSPEVTVVDLEGLRNASERLRGELRLKQAQVGLIQTNPSSGSSPLVVGGRYTIDGYRGPVGEVPADSRQPMAPPPPDGGAGAPIPPGTKITGSLSEAGVAFNVQADGDFRARTENLISERLVRESTTESYGVIVENEFIRPLGEEALSTFSIDVDTASYAIVRRFLMQDGRLPPAGAVRIEEMVNYFPYAYAPPADGRPFAVHVDAAAAPWNPRHRLVRIALKGKEVTVDARPAANLVFLLDVSGSMKPANKLPLVKQSIAMLVEELQARDRVAVVVYAGASGMVLPSTTGDRKAEILAALERLSAGGSTNGGAGIELAYRTAEEHFIPGGINRVILATDGDFNVGVTNRSDLVDLIERKAKTKVFLTALGYGMGNLKDTTLESLADKGNGNYGYVDSLREARKILVEQGMGTLHTIAKDVKIQVDFNAAKVAAYRLLGYENRLLAAQDFNDDTKDAGEVGAGHTVTALYEVVPAGLPVPGAAVEGSKYARTVDETSPEATAGALSPEMLTVRLRYKEPEGDVSTRFDVPFVDGGRGFDAASDDFRFAASVALFGMVLHRSKHCGSATLDAVREIASGALGEDEGGYRHEFLQLVDKAAGM